MKSQIHSLHFMILFHVNLYFTIPFHAILGMIYAYKYVHNVNHNNKLWFDLLQITFFTINCLFDLLQITFFMLNRLFDL